MFICTYRERVQLTQVQMTPLTEFLADSWHTLFHSIPPFLEKREGNR